MAKAKMSLEGWLLKSGAKIEPSYFELDEAITRIMSDTAPPVKSADAAYLFGENPDNEKSSFEAGARLFKSGRVKYAGICGYGKARGYEGAAHWKSELVSLGVNPPAIKEIPPSHRFRPSTHAEAWGLASYAKRCKWKIIYIVAPPIHQLRAFITAVSAALKTKTNVGLYSFPGSPQKWESKVFYSQEKFKGNRGELLAAELAKIEKYYRQGDLASAEEVLEYLDRRDARK